MGGDAMYRILQRTRATGAARLVLMGLASFVDADGYCHPSIRKLARVAAVCRNTTRQALRELVALGELELQHLGHNQPDPLKDRHRPRGGFQATHYYRLVMLRPLAASVVEQPQVGQSVTHPGGSIHDRAINIPKQVSTSSTSIAPPRDVPTLKQMQVVAQLVFDLGAFEQDEHGDRELEEAVIKELGSHGFTYVVNGNKDQLRAAITRMLAANGLKPWLPLKGQQRHERRRSGKR